MSKLLDRIKEAVAQHSIDELSTDMLARYKKKAGEQASAADKKGDFKKGNKRFSGIMKATRKQFDNDSKNESVDVSEAGPFNYGAKTPRKGSSAYEAMMKRKEQDKNYKPIEPKDNMSGIAKLTKEETEALDELSKKTLGSYYNKASVDSTDHSRKALDAFSDGDKDKDDYHFKKMNKRELGKMKAVSKGKLHTNESITESHKVGDSVIVRTSEGDKPGKVNDITKTHVGVHHPGIRGIIHYHPDYVKKVVKEEADDTLFEAVSWERWDRSHKGVKGMSKSNRGGWIASKHSSGYKYGHKEGEDHITVNGTGKEAAKKASEWAKEKGHDTVYMLEAYTPENVKNDISFGAIVNSALSTVSK